jgi:hypothetical protein
MLFFYQTLEWWCLSTNLQDIRDHRIFYRNYRMHAIDEYRSE